MVVAGRSPHTPQVYTCQCIDCGVSVTNVALAFDDAKRMTRNLGWRFGVDRRWTCPEHSRRKKPTRTYVHTCIDCGAVDTQEAIGLREAHAQSRALGWEHSKVRKTWRCPEHRIITRMTKARVQKTNAAPELARLSQTFLERQAAADAEYVRIMAERQARDAALNEAVFAQGRRVLPDHLARAIDGRGRQVVGFRNAARGAA